MNAHGLAFYRLLVTCLSVLTLILGGMTPTPVLASHTADPTSVTIAGTLQTELGCGSDWDPACSTTDLTLDAEDDVYQGLFNVPAGDFEYKAALNHSWDENYGRFAQQNGANIPLSADGNPVKFYYDHKSHWITDNKRSVIAVAPGNFQSQLGCAADWDPACLRSWLQDPDEDGTYTFETTALTAGNYEALHRIIISPGTDCAMTLAIFYTAPRVERCRPARKF